MPRDCDSDNCKRLARRVRVCGCAAVCAIFLYILGFFSVSFVFGEKREFSDIENRELANVPILIVDGKLNRDFYQGLERYVSDAFPFRDSLLSVNRWMQGMYTSVGIPFGEAPEDGGIEFFTVENETSVQTDSMDGASTPRQISASEKTTLPEPLGADEDSPPSTTLATLSESQTTTTFAIASQTADTDATGVIEPPPASGPTMESGEFEQHASRGLAIVEDQAFEIFNYSESRTRTYASIIESLAEESGIPTYVLMPLSASELFFPERYRKPENYQTPSLKLLGTLFKQAVFIDLSAEFLKSKDDYIYFRSDHHWTADGAYLGYEKFVRATGFIPANKTDMAGGAVEGFLGSLYRSIYTDNRSKLLEQEPDFVRYYEPAYGTEVMNYSDAEMTDGVSGEVLKPDGITGTNYYNVFFGGDMRLLHMRSNVANGRSIMVVRDSYGHALLPFLANNYEHVYAVEPRYFETFPLTDFIKEHEIDELLFVNHALSATSTYYLDWTVYLKRLK